MTSLKLAKSSPAIVFNKVQFQISHLDNNHTFKKSIGFFIQLWDGCLSFFCGKSTNLLCKTKVEKMESIAITPKFHYGQQCRGRLIDCFPNSMCVGVCCCNNWGSWPQTLPKPLLLNSASFPVCQDKDTTVDTVLHTRRRAVIPSACKRVRIWGGSDPIKAAQSCSLGSPRPTSLK